MNKIIITALLFVLSVAHAWCADLPEVTVQLTASRIVKSAQGKESVVSGESAKPGEIIEYRAIYKNSGKATARDVVATLPIPVEMEFVPATASPAAASSTTDGTTYSRIPLKRKVKLAGGAVVQREVPVDEYRAIRWELKDLAPAASVTVSARMKIKATQQGPVIIKLDTVGKQKSKGEEK